MSHPANEQYNDRLIDALSDYVYEALVLNEITQDQCDTMLAKPQLGLDWLLSEKRIDLMRLEGL